MLSPLPRALVVLLAFVGFTSAAFAQATPTATASPDFSAIGPKMQAFVDQGQIAGAVTLVATKDKVLHLGVVGQSDLASGRKMQTNDLFWIASMSKPITALAVAMLVDDGKLSFDDPVAKYLPEFKNVWMVVQNSPEQRVLAPLPRPITLRDLLTHTSGLGEYKVTGPHWTLAEMARGLAREPLNFAPGSRWAYSTAGLDTAGRVVEVASGMPFDRFLQTRLFDPLGMKDTTFWVSPEQKTRYADTYRMDNATGKLAHRDIPYMYGGAVTDAARPPLGGAGLFSTAEDIAKVYQMMLNNGSFNGKQIIKSETVAEMLKKQTGDLTARPGMPWGLGFSIVEDPTKMEANNVLTAGSFGHGGAFGTNSWADPKRGIIYVMMLELDGQRNPDNSRMRIDFQNAASAALGQ